MQEAKAKYFWDGFECCVGILSQGYTSTCSCEQSEVKTHSKQRRDAANIISIKTPKRQIAAKFKGEVFLF